MAISGVDFWEGSNHFVREEVATLYGRRCAYCGRLRLHPGTMTCDHVVPIAEGGSTWSDNLLPACRPCNLAKADLSIPEFRRALAAVLELGKAKVQQKKGTLELAQHFVVNGQVRFWFERHPPARFDAPVLVVLQKIIADERRAQRNG